MERNIVQIGNSMGVILPASILKRLNLSAKDPVTITHRNNSIIIKPVSGRPSLHFRSDACSRR